MKHRWQICPKMWLLRRWSNQAWVNMHNYPCRTPYARSVSLSCLFALRCVTDQLCRCVGTILPYYTWPRTPSEGAASRSFPRFPHVSYRALSRACKYKSANVYASSLVLGCSFQRWSKDPQPYLEALIGNIGNVQHQINTSDTGNMDNIGNRQIQERLSEARCNIHVCNIIYL